MPSDAHEGSTCSSTIVVTWRSTRISISLRARVRLISIDYRVEMAVNNQKRKVSDINYFFSFVDDWNQWGYEQVKVVGLLLKSMLGCRTVNSDLNFVQFSVDISVLLLRFVWFFIIELMSYSLLSIDSAYHMVYLQQSSEIAQFGRWIRDTIQSCPDQSPDLSVESHTKNENSELSVCRNGTNSQFRFKISRKFSLF